MEDCRLQRQRITGKHEDQAPGSPTCAGSSPRPGRRPPQYRQSHGSRKVDRSGATLLCPEVPGVPPLLHSLLSFMVRRRSTAHHHSCSREQRAQHPRGTLIGGAEVPDAAGPPHALSRGLQPRWIHCSIAAAILGRGSRGAVRVIPGKAHIKGEVRRSSPGLDDLRPPDLDFWDFRARL
ncbi:hypothetical protein NDU88_001957 [Pleurodeles waltl]|uniref:Uncharacterized protein n=1 Tax=Pleurodeles waltl TaxID=8319 RepID=A0AAV7T1E0_PLEWA|nr:hypothetical protein NDU88_001957 [Pleurodeles waltl]